MTRRDLEFLFGFLLLIAGVALISIPVALMVAGVLLIIDRITS